MTTIFRCEICNYKTKSGFNYNRHINSSKHKKKVCPQIIEKKTFVCECGKKYKYHTGLAKHKHKCKFVFEEKLQITTTEKDKEIAVIENEKMEVNQEIKTLKIDLEKIKETILNHNKNIKDIQAKLVKGNNDFENSLAHLNPELEIQGILLTMYDRRNKLSSQVEQEARDYFKDKVYQTVIPRNVRLSEAPSHGVPVLIYDKNCPGSKSYYSFTDEFISQENKIGSAA